MANECSAPTKRSTEIVLDPRGLALVFCKASQDKGDKCLAKNFGHR